MEYDLEKRLHTWLAQGDYNVGLEYLAEPESRGNGQRIRRVAEPVGWPPTGQTGRISTSK